jgi:hypothetical protein
LPASVATACGLAAASSDATVASKSVACFWPPFDTTLGFAAAPIAVGVDRFNGDTQAFSVGFEVQLGPDHFPGFRGEPSALQWYGPAASAFGHSGAGGSVHGAWPELRTGFSYAMNLMRRDDRDGRAQRLLSTLYACVTSSRNEGSSHNATLVEVKTR